MGLNFYSRNDFKVIMYVVYMFISVSERARAYIIVCVLVIHRIMFNEKLHNSPIKGHKTLQCYI